jgi:hypothetical protein
MVKYGMERGIKGSDARYISIRQYYRDLYARNEDLKEDMEILQERKDEAREKFLNMDEYVRRKEKELADMEIRLQQLKQDYKPYKEQEDLNLLLDVFPHVTKSLRTAKICKDIGLAIDTIKKLFTREAVAYVGKLRSPEHDLDFSVQEGKLQLYKEWDNPNKLYLSFSGQNILEWFREQFDKLHQTIRQPVITPKKSGRIKM